MQLADALVTSLRNLDLRYLFGVSGANIEHVHDAVHRLGNGHFRTVMTKSEYGAAFMADTRARVHHTLGVCCATSGGGMMNLAVGIAESFAQEVPVLAIVGQPPLSQEGRGAFQDSSGKAGTVNAERLWSAIAKHVCKITRAEDFWRHLIDALLIPLEGRRGPSVMLIPRDLMTASVGKMPAHFPKFLPTHPPLNNAKGLATGSHPLEVSHLTPTKRPPPASLCLAPQPPPSKAVHLLQPTSYRAFSNAQEALNVTPQPDACLHAVKALWQDLSRARKPLLILGSAIAREGSEALAVEFAHATGMIVATTLACTNAFPHEAPQYIGMIGAAGHPSAHDYLENEADFVIALGTQLRAMNRATAEQALQRKSLCIINAHVDQLDKDLHADYVIPLDTHTTLQALLAMQRQQPLNFDSCTRGVTYHTPVEQELTQTISPESSFSHDLSLQGTSHPNSILSPQESSEKLSQRAALSHLQPYIKRFRHLLFDAGNCAAAAAHYLQIPQTTSTTIALGMGGMGYAIAGAIGAQLGNTPDQRTLVIGGDGAFMMTGFEIHTAVDLKLPILWVIFNNNQHGMCVTRQQLFFDGRIEGNTYSSVNIAQIARGFGSAEAIWTGCASDTQSLQKALEEYFSLPPHPGVLELKIQDTSIPPFMPFMQARRQLVESL